MRKARRVFRITAVLAIGAGVISAPGQDMDKKLTAFFQDYLETQFRHQPLEATQLGDHRFDSLLDDLSREALAARRVRDVEALEALPRRIDYAQLSRDSQIDYEIFRQDLTRSIWLAENIHPFEEDPRVYGEYLSDSVYLLLTQSTLPKETNIANCLARMEQIPRVVAAAKANLRHPARPLLETAIRQNHGSIAFYEKDLFEFAGKTPQLAALKASAQRVAACLKDYQALPRKGPAAARHRRLAAGPRQVLPQARTGTGRQSDGRPGPGRCAGGIRASAAGHVRRRAPALERLLPGPRASAG